MGQLRNLARLAAATQLLPAMEGGEELLVGGQAVIEGVMMRSPHAYCIAVRKPSGEITARRETIHRPSERHKIFRWPVFRGLGTLGQALTLGVLSLKFSADTLMDAEAEAKDPGSAQPDRKKGEVSNWLMALNIVFSVGFFIAFYKFLPLFLTTALQKQVAVVGNHYVFNLVDGVIRILLFLRSEERRVGKECTSWCRSRWSPYH